MKEFEVKKDESSDKVWLNVRHVDRLEGFCLDYQQLKELRAEIDRFIRERENEGRN